MRPTRNLRRFEEVFGIIILLVLPGFAEGEGETWFGYPSSWTTKIPVGHPIRPDSDRLIDIMKGSRVYKNGLVSHSKAAWTATVWQADQNDLLMDWDVSKPSQNVPAQWYKNVPTPREAVTPGQYDGHVIVYNDGYIWEFYRATKIDNETWKARSMTRYGRQTENGVRAPYNADGSVNECHASSMVDGLTTFAEMQTGQINHAIHLSVDKNVKYSAPAGNGSYRTEFPCDAFIAGGAMVDGIKMGYRFQLKPTVEIDAIPNLTPYAKGVLKAMQQYGLIVSDGTGGPHAIRLESEVGKSWRWISEFPELITNTFYGDITWDDFQVVEPVYNLQVGRRVQVIGGALNVRLSANGKVIALQQNGASGTVLSGPIRSGGIYWWRIDYDTGTDGWSAESKGTDQGTAKFLVSGTVSAPSQSLPGPSGLSIQ